MMMKRKLLKLDSLIRVSLDRILPRNLTVRYLTALGAVAVLAVIGQILIQNSLARQAQDQKRISEIESQIINNDALRKSAVVLQLSSRVPEMRVQVQEIQGLCTQLDKTGNSPTFADANAQRAILAKLLENCQILGSLFKGAKVKTSNYQMGAVTKALLASQGAYQVSLRATSTFYERGMAAQIERFKMTELLLLVITLLVLVLEALYVFRPSVQNLYEALRIRSDFLGRMGHEVRNPMNSILGMANLLAATPLTEQQKKYLSILRRSSGGLLEMLNNLLDFSTAESGKMRVEKIRFNLYDLLCRSIDFAVFGAHAQGIELVLDLAPDVPLRLMGDPARLQQVLANLLGNAIKFTHQGEVILRVELLKAHPCEAVIQFSVIDTGIGIDKEKTHKIFDAFVQEDSTVRRRFGGSGLGLSISREIVERFGGKLSVESEKSVGSNFYFSILFTLAVSAEEAELYTVQTMLDEENLGAYSAVIAEPNQCIFDVAENLIQKSGGNLRRIKGIPELNELFARALGGSQVAQELVIVDYEYAREALPGLYARARRTPLKLSHFIFLIKTTASPEELEKLGELGVRNFLFKPVKPRQFIETLGGCLRGESPNVEPSAPVAAPVLPIEDTRALRILVVDDASDNQFLVKTYLESTPYRLTFADNGRIALEKLKASRFDVVLMDLQMPEMDGFTATELTRAWERDENLPATPIVAVSAQDNQKNIAQVTQAGFSDFLPKPVGPNELRAMILKHAPLPLNDSVDASERVRSSADATPAVRRRSVEDIEKHLLSLGPRYLANRREDIAELRELVQDLTQELHLKKIGTIGHKLKGNAKSYGFDELGLLGASLEEAVQNQNQATISALVQEIDAYVMRATARLDASAVPTP